jgi:hypothetical protein
LARLLLHLRTCRLRRLLFGLFVRLTLLPSAPYCADRRANCRPLACVTCYTSDHGPSSSTSRCPSRSPPFGFWCVRGSLLFSSLHIGGGCAYGCRSIRVYSSLLLDLGVAVIFVSQLLVVGLIVLGEREHSDLLSCGKGG